MRAARTTVHAAALAGILLVAGCGDDDRVPPGATSAAEVETEVVMHASPTCSCCGGWKDHMADERFAVRRENHDDMAAVKERLGIPLDQQSCHTSEVGGYVVEGHVPAEAVRDLLARRPDIDGIALPGMPPGAPGMDGVATEPLVVVAVDDGEVVGEFGRYQP